MNLDFTDDQQALRGALEDFFVKESPVEVVRAAEPLGFDAELWRKTADMELVALAVPEAVGGCGGGFMELAIAAELLGRTLAPVPLVEAAVATTLLAATGAAVDLDPILAGAQLATIAIHPARDGVARIVPGGAVADLVIALRDDELVLVSQTEKPNPLTPNLGAMPLAHCRVDDSGAVVLAKGEEAVALHDRAKAWWQALTAVALVGVTARAMELAVDYVLQRKAFGVLIGTFQTIQHRLADDATLYEGARLLAYQAAWSHDAALPEAGNLAQMAFLFASDTAFQTASDSLHFHGGYGYTSEYDIQLYFRRAKAWALVAGDRRAGYVEVAHREHGEVD